MLCALYRHLLVGSELNQETPRRDNQYDGCNVNHASPECDSETLSLIPGALSARTAKVSLNSPKINYYPPTHVSVCQAVQFIRFYNESRVCTSVTTRYGMLLLLLMLSNGQQVLTASWLPAWLGRLTDIFMVTTEGRWRALLQQQHLTVERDVNIADLGKWNVSLTQGIETPHLGALLGTQSAQQVFHIVISRLLTTVTELQCHNYQT